MSDADAKAKEAAAAAKPKGGGMGMIVGMILPAVLAGGASFAATKAAGGHGAPAHAEPAHAEAKPPGPTVALDPFLVSILDTAGKAHPMKLTVAVEFEALVKEETLKAFVPRIRDAILAHMRTLSYEDATNAEHSEKLREILLERIKKAGAVGAERILITDLVSQ